MKYPKDHCSYSSLGKYNTCPKQWHYSYVVYPDKQQDSAALRFGSAYHKVLEYTYGGKLWQDAYELALGEFDIGSQKDMLRILTSMYMSEVFPQYSSRVLGVESTYHIDIPEIDVPLEMKIDLETVDGVLVDHKTVGGYKPSISHNLQLNIYSYGYYKLKGIMPRSVEFHYADKRKRRIEIVGITPNYPDMCKAISSLKSMYRGILADDISPRIGSHCDYCSYRNECDSTFLSI